MSYFFITPLSGFDRCANSAHVLPYHLEIECSGPALGQSKQRCSSQSRPRRCGPLLLTTWNL